MGEFIRVEAGPVGACTGLKHMCDDYLRHFDSTQGLESYRVHYQSSIVRKSKEETVLQQELQDNNVTTVLLSQT